MNEKDSDKQTAKAEKVGPDGLTKKQRRALKVASKPKEITDESPEVVIKDTAKGKNPAQSKKAQLTEQKSKSAKETNKVATIETNKKAELQSDPQVCNKEQTQEIGPMKTREIKATHVAAGKSEDKSKAQLKAERRQLQEKQREAKKQNKNEPETKVISEKQAPISAIKQQTVRVVKPPPKILIKRSPNVELFNHLKTKTPSKSPLGNDDNIYPCFKVLAAQYESFTILGSNARCLTLLAALKQLIKDFRTPPNQDLCRSLERTLDLNVEYLQKFRRPAVSMTNALRNFKMHALQISPNLPDTEKKDKLLRNIENYISDEIQKAAQAISVSVYEKISNEDVILTFGCSSLISRILMEAKKKGKRFKVIVVDSRPLLEGREMLRRLINSGIECIYVLINAASFIMGQATKVLLGAHALLANGYVMSRIGTAQVALVAKAFNKPVLVCCETYKFSERVQTDSYVYNEIGDPSKVMVVKNADNFYVKPMNLMYDVTPPDFVTAVVTERGFLPCTSVPVILRIKPTEC